MLRYDQTLRSFASHLSVNASGPHPPIGEPPSKSPMIQGFLSSYSSNEGTIVILPSLLGSLCNRTSLSLDEGLSSAGLKAIIAMGNPFPPKTSYAKGKMKLLKRKRTNAGSWEGTNQPESSRDNKLAGITNYHPVQYSAADMEEQLCKDIQFSTNTTLWQGESTDDHTSSVENVAYAPHVLNRNVCISINRMIDDRLKYFVSKLMRKSIESNDGAVSNSVARILANDCGPVTFPSELDDQILVMKSLLQEPSNTLRFEPHGLSRGNKKNENKKGNTQNPEKSQKTAKTTDEAAMGKEQVIKTNKDTQQAGNINNKDQSLESKQIDQSKGKEMVETVEVAVKSCSTTSSGEIACLQTSSENHKISDKVIEKESEITKSTHSSTVLNGIISNKFVKKMIAGVKEKRAASCTSVLSIKEKTEQKALDVSVNETHFSKGHDREANEGKVSSEESSRKTGCEDIESRSTTIDGIVNETTTGAEKKNEQGLEKTNEKDESSPAINCLAKGSKKSIQNVCTIKAKANDLVAKIQTTLVEPPSFRSEIKSRLKKEKNLTKVFAIRGCVTSFEVPRGVKGNAIKRRLASVSNESNHDSNSPSHNGNESEAIDKNAMLVTYVTLPITFAAIVSVKVGKKGKSEESLEFGAPGTIQGTFRGSSSHSLLSHVKISLDTYSLANSMIEQVKLIIKKTVNCELQKSIHCNLGKQQRFSPRSLTKVNGTTKETEKGNKNGSLIDRNGHTQSHTRLSKEKNDYSSCSSKFNPEVVAFKGASFNRLPMSYHYNMHNSNSNTIQDMESRKYSQRWNRPYPEGDAGFQNDIINEQMNNYNERRTKKQRITEPQENRLRRKRAFRMMEMRNAQEPDERMNEIEFDSIASHRQNKFVPNGGINAERWSDARGDDSRWNANRVDRFPPSRRKSSGTLGTMAKSVEAIGLAEMNAIRRRKSSGTCGSLAVAVEAFKYAEFDAIRRSTGGPNTSMAAAAEVIRASELDTSRRGSKSADMMEALRRRSSGGGNSSFCAATEAMQIAEIASRRDSGGPSNPMLDAARYAGIEAAAKALRRKNSGTVNFPSTAEAVRRGERDGLRQGSGGHSTSITAAEKARFAELEEAYRRRSSGGGNGSLSTSAEVLRMAEIDTFRRPNNSMAAAAEEVRLSELRDPYRRRSSGGTNSSLMSAADAVRLAEMETYRRRSSGGHNNSMVAAAEVALSEIDAYNVPNSSVVAAAEAVKLAELRRRSRGGGNNSMLPTAAERNPYRRRSSGGDNGSMLAATEARLVERNPMRQRNTTAESSRLEEIDSLRRDSASNASMTSRIAEIDALRRRSSKGTNKSLTTTEEVMRWVELDAMRRRSSGGPTVSDVTSFAEMDAYRRRSSGRYNSSKMTDKEVARYTERDVLRPSTETVRTAERDALRRRSSGGLSTSLSVAAEAVRLADLNSFRRSSGGSSMATTADAIRIAEIESIIRTRRKSSGAASLVAAAEAVKLVEMEALRREKETPYSTATDSHDVTTPRDITRSRGEFDVERQRRDPIVEEEKSSSFASASISSRGRFQSNSTIRQGSYQHDHNKRRRVSFTSDGDFTAGRDS